MTQGLQFSLLFSGLDSHAAADSAVFVPEQQATSYGEQAVAFRQALETEQQSKALSKGQTVAAPQATKSPEFRDTKAESLKPRNSSAPEISVTANPDIVSTTEIVDAAENLADQWLGLIRQSSDATTLLRQKAQQLAFAEQPALAQDSVSPDAINTKTEMQNALMSEAIKLNSGEKAEQTSLSQIALADAKLLQEGSKNIYDTRPAAQAAGGSNQAAADALKITQAAETTLNNQTNTLRSEPAVSWQSASQSDKAEQAAASSVGSAVELTETELVTLKESAGAPLAKEQNGKGAQAAVASSQFTVKETQSRSAIPLSAEAVSAQDQAAALKQQILPNGNGQHSLAEPGEVAGKAISTKLTENAVTAGVKAALSASEHSDPAAVGQKAETSAEALPIVETLSANSNQHKSPKENLTTTQLASSGASKRQHDAGHLAGVMVQPQAEQSNNKESIDSQAEPAVVFNNNTGAAQSRTTKTGAAATEYLGSESNKQSALKATTDTTEKGPQSEQQNQQRQENRQYNVNRLEVTLQQTTSQTSILTQTAALDNTAETINPLQRAEQFSSVLEQLNRPQSATAATPGLAAQLKQLNLQQQDAAGQLRERVQLMVRQNVQFAEIRLDPAELGQMQIRINLQQEQATVQFIVQQQHAKELLEQQMPRLRELLQQQGMQLGEGQVQQQAKDDRQATGQQAKPGQQQPGQSAEQEDLLQSVSMQVAHSERLVDYYA